MTEYKSDLVYNSISKAVNEVISNNQLSAGDLLEGFAIALAEYSKFIDKCMDGEKSPEGILSVICSNAQLILDGEGKE